MELLINDSITRLATSTIGARIECNLVLQTNPTITVTNTATNQLLAVTDAPSQQISGSSGLEFIGPGKFQMLGTNTYTGSTTITSGALEVFPPSIPSAVIVNNSILQVNGNGEIAGDISGGGTIVINGQVTLSGNSTYTGGTQINDQSAIVILDADNRLGDPTAFLQFVSPGAGLRTTASFTMNAARPVTLNARSRFLPDSMTTLTVDSLIQGAGQLEMDGEGTLILTNGANAYQGGTSIQNGTLQVSGDGQLGNVAGVVSISQSGTLNTTANFTSNRTFQSPNQGIIDVDGGTTLTLSGVLRNQGSPGAFIKNGSGTLILNGVNTYTNGTTVNAGILQGTTDGIQGKVQNDALVIFDQITPGTYRGDMSGIGSLTKNGIGTVTLTGVNSYQGVTTINGGELQGDTQSLQGSITNNATLTFNQSNVGVFNGTISGTGTLNKQGVGIVVMSGTQPLTGTTNINVGAIQLNGSIAGPVNIGPTGVLLGNAQLGDDLSNGGLVSPGTLGIETISVGGNYNQTGSGNLFIQINSNGANDLLNVAGTTAIDGNLIVQGLQGLYTGQEVYQIVNSGGLVSGTFANEIQIGEITYGLTYQSNAVLLQNSYVGPVLPVSENDLSGNPKRVAQYLFCPGLVPTNPDLFQVMVDLLSLPPDEFIAALDRLHPSQFGALPLTVLQNTHTMADIMVSSTTDRLYCLDCNQDSNCPPNRTTVWLTPVGQWQKQKAVDDQIGFNTQTYGGSLGVSHFFQSWLNVALGAGYSYTDLDWKKSRGEGHWNSIYLGPSVGFVGGNWFVSILAQGAVNFFDIDRNIRFPGVRRTAHNSHHSYDILGRFDGGVRIVWQQVDPFFLTPTIRLSYFNMFEQSYTESGADSINLRVDSKYSSFLQPEATLKMGKEITAGDLCIVPSVELGWIRNIPLSSGNYTARFYKQDLCASDFKVKSFHQFTSQLVIGLGLTIKRIGNFNCGAIYEGRLLNDSYVNSARINFEAQF